jgi:hypothetical protein
MTASDTVQVLAAGPDGTVCWHEAEHTDQAVGHGGTVVDVFTTACGRTVDVTQPSQISEEGETPDDLSGTTVCYACARSRRGSE